MGGHLTKLCRRRKQKNEEDEDHYIDESQRLLIRALQASPFLRVPRTFGNETQKVRSWQNSIRTSQYRWWSFLPLNLFQQVIIPSNMYFIVMAILQLIEPISDSGGVPTFLLPISVVMAVTMLKDAYEDIKRHRSDALENNNVCQVLLQDGTLQDTKWKDLVPGDIVKITASNQFPADLVLISCSDAYGISYVGTVQLDGETNLKDKTCLPEMMEMFVDPKKLGTAKRKMILGMVIIAMCRKQKRILCSTIKLLLCFDAVEINYGPPNAKIYSFNGSFRLYSAQFRNSMIPNANSPLPSSKSSYHHVNLPGSVSSISEISKSQGSVIFTRRTVSDIYATRTAPIDVAFEGLPYVDFPVNINQFLWRGACLQNTEWIYGIVVYTGHNTRIFKNTKSRMLKYSKLLKSYNRDAIVLACTQFALCLVAAIIFAVNTVLIAKSWYLSPSSDRSVGSYESYGLAGFLNSLGIGFGRFVLLLSYFVPITLFVQLEMVKWCQAYFLVKDKQMCSPINDKFTSVSTVSLMEELGSITHIFSDKTGTLTLNLMQLKCIAIGVFLYGFDDLEDPTYDPLLAGEATDSRDDVTDDDEGNTVSGIPQTPRVYLTPTQKALLYKHRRSPNEFVDFDSWMMLKHIVAPKVLSTDKEKIRDFLLILALCHSVLPKKDFCVEEVDQTKSFDLQARRTFSSDSKWLSSPPSPSASSASVPLSMTANNSTSLQTKSLMMTSQQSFACQELRKTQQASIDNYLSQVHPQSSALAEEFMLPTFSYQDSEKGERMGISYPKKQSSKGATLIESSTEHDVSIQRTKKGQTDSLALTTLKSKFIKDEALGLGRQRSEDNVVSPSFQLLETNGTSLYSRGEVENEENNSCQIGSNTKNKQPKACTRIEDSACDQNENETVYTTDARTQKDVRFPNKLPRAELYQSLERHGAPMPESPNNGTNDSRMDSRKSTEYLEKEVMEEPSKNKIHLDLRRLRLVKWKRPTVVTFDASSPDELALVSGAMHLGLEFLRRPNLNTIQIALTTQIVRELLLPEEMKKFAETLRQSADIDHFGDLYKSYEDSTNWSDIINNTGEIPIKDSIVPSLLFDILEVLEFDNVRKKMSVIIHDLTGNIRLLTKGADSSMIGCAHKNQNEYLCELKNQLEDLSNKGLRTLVFGHRSLTDDLVQQFREKLNSARLIGSEDALTECYNWIETDLTLVGCTGIDDKLQPEVPQTIEAIRNAGVKLWVLTGDKLETAVSIGHSCNVLTESTYNAIISGSSESEIREQLHQYMTFIVAGQLAKEAFDQVLANQTPVDRELGIEEESVEEEEMLGKCLHCITRTLGPLGCIRTGDGTKKGRKKRKSKQPLTMSWDDFVKAITFQAKHKPVMSQPQQSVPTQLTPAQVESLIEEYLRAFDLSTDLPKREPTTPAITNTLARPSSKPTTESRSGLERNDVSMAKSTDNNEEGDEFPQNSDSQALKSRTFSLRNETLHQTALEPEINCGTLKDNTTPKETLCSDTEKSQRFDLGDHCLQFPKGLSFIAVPTLQEYGERMWLNENDVVIINDDTIGRDRSLADWEAVVNPESSFARNGKNNSIYQATEHPKFMTDAYHSQPLSPITQSAMKYDSAAQMSGSSPPQLYLRMRRHHSTKYPLPIKETREVERYTAVAITVTGEALGYVLANDSIKRYFFGLANLCATVIACRVTPKQKAEVIRQASRYLPGTVSLGVGDGANDVGMIITANVGVGICGKEGMQAVRAADFAIGEFRFLRNLLFLHGHENLRRNAIHVYHTVYKNVMFGVADWFYGFFSGFSATDLYNTWLKQIYNLSFTPFPPLLFSIFDRMLPADIFLSCPSLYPIALRPDGQLYFGRQKFVAWLAYGLISAVCVVVFPVQVVANSSSYGSGLISVDLASYGHTVFYLVVIAANFAMIPFFNTYFWFVAVGYILCFACWFITWGACSSGAALCADLQGSFMQLDSCWAWQFTMMITSVVVVGFLASYWFYKITFSPDPPTIIRERIAKGVFDVVVAPRRLGGLAVVVPRREGAEEQWRGFAFSEGMTRFQLHRRLSVIPKTVITQTAALGTAAGGLFMPSAPAYRFDGGAERSFRNTVGVTEVARASGVTTDRLVIPENGSITTSSHS